MFVGFTQSQNYVSFPLHNITLCCVTITAFGHFVITRKNVRGFCARVVAGRLVAQSLVVRLFCHLPPWGAYISNILARADCACPWKSVHV